MKKALVESKLEYESKKVVVNDTIPNSKQKSSKPIKMSLAEFQQYNENNNTNHIATSSSSNAQSILFTNDLIMTRYLFSFF